MRLNNDTARISAGLGFGPLFDPDAMLVAPSGDPGIGVDHRCMCVDIGCFGVSHISLSRNQSADDRPVAIITGIPVVGDPECERVHPATDGGGTAI
jgi:hypothetical protein